MSNAVAQPSRLGALSAARALWVRGLDVRSELRFALGVSSLWLALYNIAFWEQATAAMWHPTMSGVAFMGSLLLVVWLLQAILLMLFPGRLLLKAAASVLFPLAAASAWFCDSYGVVMNQDMMRNVAQTDLSEVFALLNSSLLLHIVVLGLIPATLVWRVRLPPLSFLRSLKHRAASIGGALAICMLCIFALSSSYAVFLREHKPIRFMISPVAPATSLVALATKNQRHANAPPIDMTGNAHRIGAPSARPLVLFLVIGETARAANFELGGYARPTNRELLGVDNLIYYPNARSCGTATAVSVPCLFSHLPRKEFDVSAAASYTNLLDVLQRSGFDVEWHDNNAGCKGVCSRITAINYHDAAFASGCTKNECDDTVMLKGLDARLKAIERDTVIVFHQMGSHGPAYSERYPARFELFKPACHSHELHRCTGEEIRNAYDNTIAYTSYVLRQQIAQLNNAPNVDSALLYISDHGESLGEQGVYLHGLPYAFAPQEQTRVPFIFWASGGYIHRTHLQIDCARLNATADTSHDNFYHTVLGLGEVRNDHYQADLDVLSACRPSSERGHE
jgi:lipid A ethanolaminephosphotransferase